MSSRNCISARSLALATAAIAAISSPALAQAVKPFNIPAQALSSALEAFGKQSGAEILFDQRQVAGKSTTGLRGAYAANDALLRLTAGAGLVVRQVNATTFLVSQVPPSAAAPAADEPGHELREIAEVVVTGTHIRGGTQTGQLVEISHTDFERAGFRDIGEALRSLPLNSASGLNAEAQTAGGGTRDNVNRATAGQSSANLLGLGSGATLVLVNGHRVAPIGYGISPDLSLIPVTAVDHIDVLADGASAIYGADAMAGVVNIITRRTFDGAEGRLRYGSAEDGLETTIGSLTTGGVWGRLSGAAGIEHRHQTGLSSADRSRSETAAQPTDLFGANQSTSAFASAQFELTPSIRLVADANYARRDIDDTVFSRPAVSRRILSGTKVLQSSVSGGLMADLSRNWRLEVTGTYSDAINKDRLRQVTLAGAPLAQNLARFENRLWTGEARATGTLLALPGGALSTAFGVAYRKETSAELTSAPLHTSRHVTSAYAELDAPIFGAANAIPFAQQLSLVAAIRHDHYSDFGGVTVPKLGVSWRPFADWTVTGSFSKSFRAPAPIDALQSYFAYIADVPDKVPGGVSRELFIGGSGGKLGPERSKNINLGVTFQPAALAGLKASLNYYRIRYSDRIAVPDPTGVYSANLTNAPALLLTRNPSLTSINSLLAGAFNVDPSGVAGPFDVSSINVIVDDRYRNLAVTRVDGFEGEASYARAAAGGTLQLTLSANYLLHFQEQLQPAGPWTERVDTIFSPPDLRARVGAIWTGQAWSAAIYGNYTDNYVDNRFAAPRKVDSWTTIDASVSRNLGSRGPTRDLRVTLSATNLLNKAPPEIIVGSSPRQAYRWDGTNASIIGRFVSLELVALW